MAPTDTDPGVLMEMAQTLALEAGGITMEHFGAVLSAEEKGDGTPVTVADRAAEARMRERIEARFPHHGILGEEFGETNPDAEVRWILDPIDGTRSFVRGVPLYGVLVGIEIRGNPWVGVAHFPALRETVAAARGLGCRWNGGPARVSTVRELSGAAVMATEPEDLLEGSVGRGWERLVRETSLARTWGDCYGHVLVATGRAEIMIDPVLSAWDAAPFVPILQEAGGRFTDLSGEARVDGGSGLSTNGHVHDEVLEILAGG